MKNYLRLINSERLLIVPVTALVVSIIFISFYRKNTYEDTPKYPYLAYRLFAPEKDDLIVNFTQLRDVMKDYAQKSSVKAGVYFEYLPTGASIGTNDQMVVEIASLTKVPSVMAAYKSIDNGNLKLDNNIIVQDKDVDKNFGDLWQKGKGTELTVEQAIDLSLKNSDNTAVNTLVSSLDKDALDKVYNELDLPKTRIGPFPSMSPKSYASVFRNLYLSAYLQPESSNQILEKLSDTKFTDKLPAGVPHGIKVSHKIGVFQLGNDQVYNDCGIVYVPYRPYILCIMVVGNEESARNEIISYSKMVFSYVSQVKASKQLRASTNR